jgi:excisionase family DNA binding protein
MGMFARREPPISDQRGLKRFELIPAFDGHELGEGNAVKVIPIHAELTTQEAADLLNVSRPHVVKLLETDALKGHKAGKHRRILFADLMEYKNKRLAESEAAMDELTQQAQQLKMRYE